MALKYYFEFTDTEKVSHRCEILEEGFTGEAKEVNGNLSMNRTQVKDNLDPIRGSSLKINIEAESGVTYDDLYSEEERTFRAKYLRNGIVEFDGWLSPEGVYLDFVRDKWEVNLNCTGGLGFLKNLSYVENNGLDYIGRQTPLEIIVNCLKRTGIEQDIYTSVHIRPSDLPYGVDPLANTNFNSDRFIKDDGKTTMDCIEVLTSVLECFCACIVQRNGAWHIFSPNPMFINATQQFYAYNHEGTALSPATVTIDLSQDLGSQINNFYPHHVGENQQVNTESSLGAYRINYKYGLVKRFVSNNTFVSYSNTNIPDYTIVDSSYLSFPTNRLGVIIDTNSTSIEVLRMTDTISLSENDRIKLGLRTIANALNDPGRYYGAVIEVKLVGTTTYYLKVKDLISGASTQNRVFSASWETAYNTIKSGSFLPGGDAILEDNPVYESEDLPIDGNVEIRIYTSIITSGAPSGTPQGSMIINELTFAPIINEGDIKGENHTFQRTANPSTKIKNVKTVYNGDNVSDIYEGAIYKADGTTPTQYWTREGYGEAKPLLRIMGENKMRMNAKPLKKFKGSVYGYLPYLSVVSIDGLDGKYMAVEHNYNAIDNVTEVVLKEVLNEELLDIEYEYNQDFGNVVQPTIRG